MIPLAMIAGRAWRPALLSIGVFGIIACGGEPTPVDDAGAPEATEAGAEDGPREFFGCRGPRPPMGSSCASLAAVCLLGALGAGMSDEEMRLGFDLIDTDRNGSIDFAEFRVWWEVQ